MKITAYEVRDDEKEVFIKAAETHHCQIQCLPETLTLSSLKKAAGSDGVTTLGRSILDDDLLDELKKSGILFAATRTIGYDHIHINYAKQLGLGICNAAYGPEGVADYTVMLMLMSLRHYKQALYRANTNDYSLYGLQGRVLKDLTVGIAGAGRIGKAVLKDLSGFGCRLLVYSSHEDPEIKALAEYVSLTELYQQCDVISFHLPLTADTMHMVNRDTLQQMKDGVVLINTARGELMDIRALEWGIENEKIGALAMDVFEGEQGIYHEDKRCDIIKNKDMAYLRQFPNVVMTQHLAFYTDSAVESMVMQAVGGLVDMKEGRECRTRLC